MTDPGLTGGCLCRKVRYLARGTARDLCFCHCESCRRAAGSVTVPWATFDVQAFTIEQGQLATFASSPPVLRGFCSSCGTSLTYAHAERPGEIDVTITSFDDPKALTPECHIWVQDKLPWVVLGDGLPAFDTTRKG